LQEADKQITLKWNNPKDTDYTRTVIVRKEGSKPTSRTDGKVVYEGTNEEYTDINLNNTRTYYYAIYTYDKKPNYSSPVYVQATPQKGKTTIETTAKQTPQTTQTQTQIRTVTLKHKSEQSHYQH